MTMRSDNKSYKKKKDAIYRHTGQKRTNIALVFVRDSTPLPKWINLRWKTVQLVYFNDLHKNLGCNRVITSKISIFPAIFAAAPIKFYASARPLLPSFSARSLRPRTNAPSGTDISIAQKTCVFRQGDISVTISSHNKLIYQFRPPYWNCFRSLRNAFASSAAGAPERVRFFARKKPLHPARCSGLYTI